MTTTNPAILDGTFALETWVELTDGSRSFIMTQDDMRHFYLRVHRIMSSARVVPLPAKKMLVLFTLEQTAWTAAPEGEVRDVTVTDRTNRRS